MLGDASRRSRAASQATYSIRAWLACKIAIPTRS
jgi:hypothetical protein